MALLNNIKGIIGPMKRNSDYHYPKHIRVICRYETTSDFHRKKLDVDIERKLISIAKNQQISIYKMVQGTTSVGFTMQPALVYSP